MKFTIKGHQGKIKHICMKYLITICLLFIGQWSEAQETIQIKVSNVGTKGKVFVAITDQRKDFLTDNRLVSKVVTREQALQGFSVQLPKNTRPEIAIAIFQDINGNDKLDTNLLGIPKEAFGFSNKVVSKWKKPEFNDAKFKWDSKKLIMMELANW